MYVRMYGVRGTRSVRTRVATEVVRVLRTYVHTFDSRSYLTRDPSNSRQPDFCHSCARRRSFEMPKSTQPLHFSVCGVLSQWLMSGII